MAVRRGRAGSTTESAEEHQSRSRIRFAPDTRAPIIEWETDFLALLVLSRVDRARPPAPTSATALEASKRLGISRSRVRELIVSGAIPASSTGAGRSRRHRIPSDWLEAHAVEPDGCPDAGTLDQPGSTAI